MMEKWQKSQIGSRLAYLKEHKATWESYLAQGSTDQTYAVTCTAKILEAEAEMNGIEFVLSTLGYKAEFSKNNIGIFCEINA